MSQDSAIGGGSPNVAGDGNPGVPAGGTAGGIAGADTGGATEDASQVSLTETELNAKFAKERAIARRKGQADLLQALGAKDLDELQGLIEAGRGVAPKQEQSDQERAIEKLKSEHEKQRLALAEEAAALRMERDRVAMANAVRDVVAELPNLAEGAQEVLLSALGVGNSEYQIGVDKKGNPVVLDADGDETGKSIKDYVTGYFKKRPFLHRGASAPVQRGEAPKGPPTAEPTVRDMRNTATRRKHIAEILKRGAGK
jgi:hypothetical protein